MADSLLSLTDDQMEKLMAKQHPLAGPPMAPAPPVAPVNDAFFGGNTKRKTSVGDTRRFGSVTPPRVARAYEARRQVAMIGQGDNQIALLQQQVALLAEQNNMLKYMADRLQAIENVVTYQASLQAYLLNADPENA